MKTHQTFRIDDELLKRVRKQAKKENRAVGNLIETAVKQYIESILR